MVAKERKFASGKTVHSFKKFKSLNNRCLKDGFRGPFEQTNFSRSLDKAREKITYQQAGVGSSAPISSTFSSTTRRSQCVNKNRQNNCGTIHEQTRGNTISPSLLPGMESIENCNRQHVSKSSAFIGQSQYSSRRLIENKNTSHRMDSERYSSLEDFFYLWGHP